MEEKDNKKEIKEVKEVKDVKDINNEIKNLIEKSMSEFISSGIHKDNLDTLYKLVDIHKDLCNEEYWEDKRRFMDMRYRSYNGYNDYNDYGRQGVRGTGPYSRYNDSYNTYNDYGHEILEDMKASYGDYKENSNSYNHGDYRAEQGKMQSLEYMLKSVEQFFKMLNDEAQSPEEKQLIQKTVRKIGEM